MTGSPRSDAALASRVAFVVDGPKPGAIDVRVDLRGGQIGVPEHLLNRPQVGAPFDEVRGERMAQLVRRRQSAQAGFERVALQQLPKSLAGEWPSAIGDEKGARVAAAQKLRARAA